MCEEMERDRGKVEERVGRRKGRWRGRTKLISQLHWAYSFLLVSICHGTSLVLLMRREGSGGGGRGGGGDEKRNKKLNIFNIPFLQLSRNCFSSEKL